MKLWTSRTALGVIAGAAMLLGADVTRAADVTIDTSARYQTIQGFGTCLAWWVNNPSQSVYYTPAFRYNYAKDLGFNILRVEMHPAVLMGPGATLASRVDLADDVATNVSKFNFAKPQSKVFGDFAQYLRDNV